MPTDITPTIQMDFHALNDLKSKMSDSGYVEYIWHKVHDNKNAEFEGAEKHTSWQFPECWRARYWLNYILHGDIFKDKSVLEIGSLFNFYSVWSILAGAKTVHAIEPHTERYELAKEYVSIRNMSEKIATDNTSIEDYMKNYNGAKYDIVFFQDVMYYLHNPIEVINFISKVLKPRHLFLETSVCDDFSEDGHFILNKPNETAMDEYQIWEKDITLSLTPSRNALRNLINMHDWKIITYYNYKDFIGHGESPPRKAGRKDYYVLERKE
jgi:SAM-dependent methyltransferase